MSSTCFLASLGLLLAGLVPGHQPSAAPTLPAAIRRGLPAGYTILAAEPGDLNRDALPDWVVVLHRSDEQKTSDVVNHPTKRPLLLFVGGAGGTYDAGTGKVVFNAYSLAANESRVSLVTFTMPASPASGFVTGAATVTTTSNDFVARNNAAALTTSLALATPDLADLTTSILASATTVAAGSPVSYTIKFRNNTASTPASNVVPMACRPASWAWW